MFILTESEIELINVDHVVRIFSRYPCENEINIIAELKDGREIELGTVPTLFKCIEVFEQLPLVV